MVYNPWGIYCLQYTAYSNMAVDHNNLLGKVIYIGTSSSCKDSEVAVMLWNVWTGYGDKPSITWLPGE